MLAKNTSTINQFDHLKTMQENLYTKIHESVLLEQSTQVQLIDQITMLTEQLLEVNSQIRAYEQMKNNQQIITTFLLDLPTTLKDIPIFDPNNCRILFREDLFVKLVNRIIIIDNRTLQFDLLCGHTEIIEMKGYSPHRLPTIDG